MYILRHNSGQYVTRDMDLTAARVCASIYAFTLDAFAIARRAHNLHGGIITVIERRTDRRIGSVPDDLVDPIDTETQTP